jgi:hypothetical protein
MAGRFWIVGLFPIRSGVVSRRRGDRGAIFHQASGVRLALEEASIAVSHSTIAP